MDYKLYKNIDTYFDFIIKNLEVYSKKDYEKLSTIIKISKLFIEDSLESKDFDTFYGAYISLRDDINKFKLSKKEYKERHIY